MAELRIMSNNQWKCDRNLPAWEAMGMDCSAEVRSKGLARVILETSPDILGLQECSALMAEEQMQNLAAAGAKYALLWGRDTPILYKPDKFEVVDAEYLIYPTEVPGYEGEFNNGKTKSYCIAVFRVKENGRLLIFASTHLWWKSDNPESRSYQANSGRARAYQLGILMDKAASLQEKYACPAIIVGDMNANVSSEAIQSAFSRGWIHARDMATIYADPGNGHHPCGNDGFQPYEPKSWELAIDHILVRGGGVAVRRYDRLKDDWYMPVSDHLPVWIDCEI